MGEPVPRDIRDVKRVKTSELNGDEEDISEKINDFGCEELRRTVKDLQFIVNHLREDVSFSAGNGIKFLKDHLKGEIELLVFSLMEESIRDRLCFKDTLARLEGENSLLIENENLILEELAKLTIENSELKAKNSCNNSNNNLVMEQVKEIVFETSSELQVLEKDLFTRINSLRENGSEITRRNEELNSQLNDLKAELETLKGEKERIEQELKEEKVSKCEVHESEERMRELLTINCELIDLNETYKRNEQIKGDEIDLLNRTITAQKIELERAKETLLRERKISSLKISDLKDQLVELTKHKEEEEEEEEENNSDNNNNNNNNSLLVKI